MARRESDFGAVRLFGVFGAFGVAWLFDVFGALGVVLVDLPGGLPTGRFPFSSFAVLDVTLAFASTLFFVLSFALDFTLLIWFSLSTDAGGTLLSLLGVSFPVFSTSCCLFPFAFCWSFAILDLKYYHSRF